MLRNGTKIGLLLPQAETDAEPSPRWTDTLTFAVEAEQAGFDSLWAVDHMLFDWPRVIPEVGWTDLDASFDEPEGFWECWTILAALAARTGRIELGTLVSCAAYRNPALLAKIVETVDEISGGRVILGLGAGDFPEEFEAFGFEWDRRISRFEEGLRIVHALTHHGAASFHGEFYQLVDCELRPRGPRPGGVPLMIGALANRPRMLRLVTQYADIWNNWVYGHESSAAEAKRRLAAIDEACLKHGRDPASLQRSLTVGVWWGGRRYPGEQSITGTTAEMAEQLHQISELGYSHIQVALMPRNRTTLETFARVLDELNR